MTADSIARIRRFNRAVTAEAGALDASYLGRGRPLGSARVLCAIGVAGCDLGHLRDTLALDSGLLSRILRVLEEEGLIVLTTDPADRRRRLARPTAAGAQEIAAYDLLSNERAASVLDALPRRRDDLLDAMDRIAIALNRDRITLADTDPEDPDARSCLLAYYTELARRFDTGFDRTRSLDPEAASLRPPLGSFVVARCDGLPIACAGLKGNGGTTGEVKRVWVAPAARGFGLAPRLMAAVEGRARALGMTLLRLDTNRALTEAIALYRATGWAEVPAFNAEPYAHHWFAKPL